MGFYGVLFFKMNGFDNYQARMSLLTRSTLSNPSVTKYFDKGNHSINL